MCGARKIHPEWGDPDPKRQLLFIFSSMWILAFKPLVSIIQSL